ncbi:VOC family protein [Nocardia tengchongensis]|uniref:VOC family protein n=1 Tax=Nocardia tengchongensis TaxID=2055889 RepID=UPI0036144696
MEILSSRVILRPRDYEKTLAFYRDALGLAIAREYPGGTVFFAGQALLEVAGHGRADDAPSGFAGAIWLQVRDCADAATELALRGIAIDRAPVREPWGLIEMWIRDPDEVPLVLVEIPANHPIRRDIRGDD